MPKKPLEPKRIFTLAEAFIVSQGAHWGHDEWEELLEEAKAKGVDVEDDEAKRNLGNIIEGGRFFYESACPVDAEA